MPQKYPVQQEVQACRKSVTDYQRAEQERKAEEDRRKRERERQEAALKERERQEDLARERKKADAQSEAQEKREREDRDRRERDEARKEQKRQREEQAKRDEAALERAAERSKQEQEQLRQRTEGREAEKARLQERADDSLRRYTAESDALAAHARDLVARLEDGFQRAVPGLQSAPNDGGNAGLGGLDLDGLETPSIEAMVSDIRTTVADALQQGHGVLDAWARDAMAGQIAAARTYLIENVVHDTSLSGLANAILDGGVDGPQSVGRLASRAFNSLAEQPALEVSDSLSGWINERLRTSTDRVYGRPWAGDLGNRIVELGVSQVVNSAVEVLSARVAEHAGQAWDSAVGRGPAPSEGTFERAEYDLWRHAEPSSLLSSTWPLGGPQAIKGFYQWGETLVDKFSTFMGFAVEEIGR